MVVFGISIGGSGSSGTTTVPNGGTGATSFTAYAPIFGGTTSTGPVQSGTVGTAGHVLTSNGAGAIATFQAVSASAGGSDTQIQFNNSGSLGGVAGLVVNKTTGAVTQLQTALGATTAAGVTLTNTTAAAAGAQQVSPSLYFRGNGWKTNSTAASQSVEFRNFLLPLQAAAAPNAILTWQASVNGGAFANAMTLDEAGRMAALGGVATGGTGYLGWTARSLLFSPANGKTQFADSNVSVGVVLDHSVANVWSLRNFADGAAANMICGTITCGIINTGLTAGAGGINTTATGYIGWFGRTLIYSPADRKVLLSNAAVNAGVLLDVTTNDTLRIRNYADSADGALLAGAAVFTGPVTTQGYTVGTLPAGTVGMRAYVTDATAPIYLGALVGGGAVVCPVFYNGAAWVSA